MKIVFSRLWRKTFAVVALIPAWAAMPVQAAGPAFDNPLSESSVQATRDAVRSVIGAARALPTVPAAARSMPSAPPVSSGRGLPELAISNGDNVAGVLEYCVQSNVLNRASVDSVKATLLSHVGMNLAESADTGYRDGTAGLLVGVDGRTLDLRSAQPVLKEQACDYVLSNTKSLI